MEYEAFFLQTSNAGTIRHYDLTAHDSYIARDGAPPNEGNYLNFQSRARQLTEGANDPKKGFGIRVIIHSERGDFESRTATAIYCKALADEFIGALRRNYFKRIELGASQIDRIHNQYQVEAILPGTYAVRLLSSLSNAITAKLSFYLVSVSGRIYVEYLHFNVHPRLTPVGD